MSDQFNFIENPIMPGQQRQQPMYPAQMTGYNAQPAQYVAYPTVSQNQQMVQNSANSVSMSGGGLFNIDVVPDNVEENNSMVIRSEVQLPEDTGKKRKGRARKDDTTSTPIIRAEGVVEDNSALYTYNQTTNMLHETVQQLDMVACEVKEELDNVRLSRTMRNKQNNMIGLASALGKILETKVSAISQINNAISKANDLDYKREKDKKMYESNAAADDKYIMDMYNSFIRNPMGNTTQDVLGPNLQAASVMGGVPSVATGIVRADMSTGDNPGMMDAGYFNYKSNMTPEQNLMLYENNPNVQTVVIYDVSNGNKWFEIVDITTGQAVPNVNALDNRFMEDTYLDLKNKIAKNNNLHQTYPIIVINEGVASQY